MKKCPSCGKTYEDSMRFCQADGTSLVEEKPFDPYQTIVARPEDGAPSVENEKASSESGAADNIVSIPEEPAPISEPEDILDLPEADPLKTMYASDAELKEMLVDQPSVDEPPASEPLPVEVPVIPEPPPFVEPPKPEPPPLEVPVEPEPPPAPEPPAPSFSAPDVPTPGFGEPMPPPSPFMAPDAGPQGPPPAPPPVFDEPATVMQPQFSNPFEQPAPPAQWTPPPVPAASWQNQPIGSDTPFQPPPAGTGSVNQILPIISLVLGILSLCCYISPVTGLAAIITGFLGMKNANNDPQNYGGKGLAIAGMITGGIFFLVGVAYYVIVILAYAGIIAGSMLQGY